MESNLKNYLIELSEFECLCQESFNLSRQIHNKQASSWQEQIAGDFFGKASAHSFSLLKLLPESSFFSTKPFSLWDLSSIALLGRALVDTYNMFFYLCIDNISPEEKEFRKILWQYHGEVKTKELINYVNPQSSHFASLDQDISRLWEQLNKHSLFSSISPKNIKKMQDGETTATISGTEISERAGIKASYYKMVFRYLSQYVHAYPQALSQLAVFKADNPESLGLIKNYSTSCYCISCCLY